MLRRLTALLLGAALCCGCSSGILEAQQPQQEETAGSSQAASAPLEELTLAYNQDDVLHPYRLTSQINQQLGALIYEPLVEIGTDFSPRMRLAASAETEGMDCIVTLRQDARFSDGSAVTAQDVLYSFQQAKGEGSIYQAGLATILSAEAEGERIIFHLVKGDIYAANLLTFPIIQQASAESDQPLGSGPYVPVLSASQSALQRNPHYTGQTGSLEEIQLVSFPDEDSLRYGLQVGTVDFIYSEDPSSAEGGTIHYAGVPTNDLVYLGMNLNQPLISDYNFRLALHQALNREELVRHSYGGWGTPASTPVHPDFYDFEEEHAVEQDLESANNLLDTLGYEIRDEEGYRTTAGGRLVVTLLYNSDQPQRQYLAQELVTAFARIGIQLEVQGLPYEEFLLALESMNWDFYLAQAALPYDMDFSMLLAPGGSFVYGQQEDQQMVDLVTLTLAGNVSCDELVERFQQKLPWIPLLYTQGVVSFSQQIDQNITATQQNIFYNLAEWTRTP